MKTRTFDLSSFAPSGPVCHPEWVHGCEQLTAAINAEVTAEGCPPLPPEAVSDLATYLASDPEWMRRFLTLAACSPGAG